MRTQESLINNIRTSAGDVTALASDEYVGITNTDQIRTVTLPAAASVGAGRVITIKDQSGAAGTNKITVDGNASETIDGATTKDITTNYGSLRLFCNGTAWFSI